MAESTATFRRLHEGPGILVLPNCWDAGSALLLEHLGAEAVATTSAGVAWSHGFPDGNALPTDRLLATVAAIARVLRVPLTVDVEGGYSDDPRAVSDLVAALAGAGATGINLEDGAEAPDLLAAKIGKAKEAAARRGFDVFVNARTDVYLRGLVPPNARADETLSRASRYRDAGADGLFVPKVADAGEIAEIASSCRLPLNVLAWPGVPVASELAALGVRRLSSGSAIAQGAWARTAAVAREFLRTGAPQPLFDDVMSYSDIDALVSDEAGATALP